MTGKRDKGNSDGFKLLAERYVEIQGAKLEIESESEEIKVTPKPEKPKILVKKKRNQLDRRHKEVIIKLYISHYEIEFHDTKPHT